MRFASEVKFGGTNLFSIAPMFNDFNSLDDYFSPKRFIIAIIDTLFADITLSLFIIFTN